MQIHARADSVGQGQAIKRARPAPVLPAAGASGMGVKRTSLKRTRQRAVRRALFECGDAAARARAGGPAAASPRNLGGLMPVGSFRGGPDRPALLRPRKFATARGRRPSSSRVPAPPLRDPCGRPRRGVARHPGWRRLSDPFGAVQISRGPPAQEFRAALSAADDRHCFGFSGCQSGRLPRLSTGALSTQPLAIKLASSPSDIESPALMPLTAASSAGATAFD